MFQHTWHFLRIAVAGFINRQQQDVIAYLQEENRILREKLGPKGATLYCTTCLKADIAM